MLILATIVSAIAGISALAFCLNAMAFRKATDVLDGSLPPVSILIPARDEAKRIESTLQPLLGTSDVEFEIVVLDDHSQDATAEIVQRLARTDHRVRLIHGDDLPANWCGKQFACHQLAAAATHEELLFIDADVQLSSDAVARAMAQRRMGNVDLLSGFPRQIVKTMGEAMLVPMMHMVLLTYLPFILMRRTRMKNASAGCGQFFLTTRSAYQQSGGHETIKNSLHDGVQLPRAYRRSGLRTDVFDANDIAKCRMYRGWSATWQGLSKNAYEGIANERLIVPFTCFLLLGYCLPALLLAYLLLANPASPAISWLAGATILSYLPRLIAAFRFDRAWLAALLLPLSILLFVTLQWTALVKTRLGTKSTWRGRDYSVTSQ